MSPAEAQAVGAKPVTFHRQVSSASLAPVGLKWIGKMVRICDWIRIWLEYGLNV